MKPQPIIVAIVDDEESVRRALQRLLASYGIVAHVYGEGEKFLASLDAQTPDCVVLDLHMPVMSGFEIQQRLADESRSLPVIAITGHDTPDTQARTIALGAIAYLRKPVSAAQIMDAIGTATSGGHRAVTP